MKGILRIRVHRVVNFKNILVEFVEYRLAMKIFERKVNTPQAIFELGPKTFCFEIPSQKNELKE